MDRKKLVQYLQEDTWKQSPPQAEEVKILLISAILLYLEKEITIQEVMQQISLIQAYNKAALDEETRGAIAVLSYMNEQMTKGQIQSSDILAIDATITDVLFDLTNKPSSTHYPSSYSFPETEK